MRLLFCGTPKFAADIMQSISLRHEIKGVITRVDKPFGRKRILKAPEVKVAAIQCGLEVFQPDDGVELDETILGFMGSVDVVLVVAFGRMLSKRITDEFFCVNLHGSVLPYLRGASPVQTSIINGYKHMGLTLFRMDEIMDGGDVLDSIPVREEDVCNMSLVEVFERLAVIGTGMINRVLANLDSIKCIPQQHDKATYCKKINRSHGLLNLESARECFLRFIALKDWPGVHIMLKDGSILKIVEMESVEYTSENKRGQIIEIHDNGMKLGCTRGSLLVRRVVLANKPKMEIKSFLQSRGLKIYDVLCEI